MLGLGETLVRRRGLLRAMESLRGLDGRSGRWLSLLSHCPTPLSVAGAPTRATERNAEVTPPRCGQRVANGVWGALDREAMQSLSGFFLFLVPLLSSFSFPRYQILVPGES